MNKKLYQIVVKGNYFNFSGIGKYHSKNVYYNKPSKKEINDFINKCCDNNTYINSLERESIKISVVELTIKDE